MARYEIRFGRSPSANFATAVRLAETVDGHRFERGEHVVPIGQRQLPVVERLIALVAGWRCTSFVIDGMLVSRGQLHMLLRVIECHRERRLSGLEELYCWGLPGPRRGALPCRLVELSMPIVPGADYGNRQLLRRLMTAHARGVMADACPAFDGRALQAAAADFIGPEPPGPAERRRLNRLLHGLDLSLDEERTP